MKILETQLRIGWFDMKQLKRVGNIAIYEASKRGKITHYETIIIQNHDGYEIAGHVIPPSEFYPKSEAFGDLAWCLPNINRAEEVFNQLVLYGKKQEKSEERL